MRSCNCVFYRNAMLQYLPSSECTKNVLNFGFRIIYIFFCFGHLVAVSTLFHFDHKTTSDAVLQKFCQLHPTATAKSWQKMS